MKTQIWAIFFELTPEMLDAISGGVMTEKAEEVLDALISVLKKDTELNNNPHSAQEAIDFITKYCMKDKSFENVNAKDVTDYINKNW